MSRGAGSCSEGGCWWLSRDVPGLQVLVVGRCLEKVGGIGPGRSTALGARKPGWAPPAWQWLCDLGRITSPLSVPLFLHHRKEGIRQDSLEESIIHWYLTSRGCLHV